VSAAAVSAAAVWVAAPPVPADDTVAASEDSWCTGLTEQNVAELVRNNSVSTGLLLPHSSAYAPQPPALIAAPDTRDEAFYCGAGRQRGWGQWDGPLRAEEGLLRHTHHTHHTHAYQHGRAEGPTTMLRPPYDYYADDDDDSASDLARHRVMAAPRQPRQHHDPLDDWCDLDDSVVLNYGLEWGIGEAMGEFTERPTAVW